MNNKRRVIRITSALVLAIVGTVALMAYVKSAKDEAVAGEALVDVYVVDELVPKGAGEAVIEKSVSIAQVPARLRQPGAITDLADVDSDEVAAIDLQPGDQLLAARLTTKQAVSDEVTDKVQISVRLEAERAVGGALAKGDLVGVYLSFDPFELETVDPDATAATSDGAETTDTTSDTTPTPKKSPNMTSMEFQHVLVTNVQTTNAPVTVDTDSDDASDGPQIVQVSGSEYIVTLALSPEQSERFVFATEFGHVWLSKDPATVSDDGTRLVTLGNVYEVVAP